MSETEPRDMLLDFDEETTAQNQKLPVQGVDDLDFFEGPHQYEEEDGAGQQQIGKPVELGEGIQSGDMEPVDMEYLPEPLLEEPLDDGDEEVLLQKEDPEESSESPLDQEFSTAFWKIEFYQQFFQVEHKDIFQRLIRVFLPYKNDFLSLKKVDLWGSFWGITTFFILVVITSNVMGLLHYNAILEDKKQISKDGGVPSNIEEWTADFTTVSVGFFLLYGYCAFMGAAHWALMKWLQVPISLGAVLSLYGYSFYVLMPFTLICITTYDLIRWGVLAVAFVYQTIVLGVHLFFGVGKHLQGGNRVHMITHVVMAIIPQVLIYFVFKLFFYSTWIRTIVSKL